MAFLHGAGVKLDRSSAGDSPNHGSVRFVADPDAPAPAAVLRAPDGSVLPAVQAFSEHNGNEARQSYHGLPANMVQPIVSPQNFVFGPMQINTNFKAQRHGGPVPRTSQAPPNANYSGLLECPCTTRIVKTPAGYVPLAAGHCSKGAAVTSASECFAAVASVGVTVSANQTTSNSSLPAGCTVQTSAAGLAAVFNALNTSSTPCSAGGSSTHVRGAASGSSLVAVSLDIDATADNVTITLSGPADKWFAAGFNASQMADLPWTVVVGSNGAASVVTERKLANHEPGQQLTPQIKVLSSSVAAGRRTVVLSRPLKGIDANRMDFAATAGAQLPIIVAVGSTPTFDGQKHTAAATASILLLAVPGSSQPASTCICKGGTGMIGEKNGFVWGRGTLSHRFLFFSWKHQQYEPARKWRSIRAAWASR